MHVGRRAFAEQDFSRRKAQLFDVFGKPLQLVFRQIGENCDTPQCLNSVFG